MREHETPHAVQCRAVEKVLNVVQVSTSSERCAARETSKLPGSASIATRYSRGD